MSKYTRLNKINHYHDSGSNSQTIQKQNSRIRPPLSSSSSSSIINREGALNNINNNLSSNKKLSLLTISTTNQSTILKTNYRNININNNKTTMNYNLKIAFIAFISILLLLLVSLNGVYSLNCYHCSSADDPGCDEAFTGKANYTETDCTKHLKPDQVSKVCRKIVQYIEHKKVVIRSCGYIDEHSEQEKEKKNMCYKRSGTFAIMMESCNCYENNCNNSASLVPNLKLILLIAIFMLFIFGFLYLYFDAGRDSEPDDDKPRWVYHVRLPYYDRLWIFEKKNP